MTSNELNNRFDKLINSLTSKTVFVTMGDDPVYYFVFSPSDALFVKRKLNILEAKLRHEGYTPHFFSLGKQLHEFIRNDEFYPDFVEFDREHPFEFSQVNESIKDTLNRGDHTVLDEWVIEQLEKTEELENGVLILIDIELLHPYAKIGRIEANLQGKVNVPIIVMYPGKRTSRYGLKFLDFYPPDGNYRSIHIGGEIE